MAQLNTNGNIGILVFLRVCENLDWPGLDLDYGAPHTGQQIGLGEHPVPLVDMQAN